MAKLIWLLATSSVETMLADMFSNEAEGKVKTVRVDMLLFLKLFLVQSCLLGLWEVFVYPNFISPLRHLPGPSVRNLASCRAHHLLTT